MTMLARAPARASVHDWEIASSETQTEMTPSAHHQRGQAKRERAVARKRRLAVSHRTPNSGEIGCVSCGELRDAERFRDAEEVNQAMNNQQDCEESGHTLLRRTHE